MRNNLRGIAVCLTILILILMLFVSCNTNSTPSIPSSLSLFVPQRADLIAKIDIQQIVNDGDFNYLCQQWTSEVADNPQTLNQMLDTMYLETGIDPRDFNEAVVYTNTLELANFAGASRSPGVPYFGALAMGTFSEENLIGSVELKSHTKFDTYMYKGSKVYTYTEDQVALLGITCVDDQLIIIGSVIAVEDTIDVMVGDKQPINGAVYDLYETLGDVVIKMASTVPSVITSQLPTRTDIEGEDVNLQSLGNVTMVGLTFDKIDSTTITEVQLHCGLSTSAQEIDQLVDSLIILWKQEVPNAQIENELDKLTTTASGSVFSLRITETIADIVSIIQSLATPAPAPAPIPRPAPAPAPTPRPAPSDS
ncbi:hypothetical protein ACFLYR_06470 [Chloroflexota bacterium]